MPSIQKESSSFLFFPFLVATLCKSAKASLFTLNKTGLV
jgi:hypothetical protein